MIDYNTIEERESRQVFFNDLMRLRGQDNFEKEMNRLDLGEQSSGRALGYTAIKGFNETLNIFIQDQTSGNRSNHILIKKLIADQYAEEIELLVNPRDLAKIAISSILNSIAINKNKRLTATSVSFSIGKLVEFLLNEQQMDLNAPQHKRGIMQRLGKQDRAGDPEQVQDAINYSAINAGYNEPWEESEHLAVGESIIRLLLLSDVTGTSLEGLQFAHLFPEEYVKTVAPNVKTNRYFTISEEGEVWLEEHDEFVKSLRISFLPMLIKPREWDETLTGGFHDPAVAQRYTFIKGQSDKSTLNKLNLYREGFNTLFKTINAMQATAFRVNETIHKALEYVIDTKVELNAKGCPSWISAWETILGEERAAEYMSLRSQMIRVDGRYDDESWELHMNFLRTFIQGDDKEVLKGWREYRLNVKKVAIGNKSRSLLAQSIRDDSSLFLGEPEVYFPYNADSRTRIYPLSGQFSPQGSDVAKGLLEFAHGKVVTTKEQVDFIAHQLAGTFGKDKCSLDDRVKWVLDNEDEILASAEDFRIGRFWMEADAPFSALLACIEWKKYVDEGLGFTTTLPISFDGSTNALQHYSAMFLDADMAARTNLVDSDVPADLYKDVSDKALDNLKSVNGKSAKRLVDLHYETGEKIFSRTTDKKSVMCLGYSISKRSSSQYCRDAIAKYGLPLSHADLTFVNKNIGNSIWKAMEDTLVTPFEGRDLLQGLSHEMIDNDLQVRWITPTGFGCGQTYREVDARPNRVRVNINGNRYARYYPKLKTTLDAVKNANALAPNIVHSFDSSHLQFSTCAAVLEGITDFLMIHDSFATNAVDAQRFSEIIREEFVKMYQVDHLNRLREDVKERLAEVDVEIQTDVIVRGDFDLDNVLSATHFFR